MIVLLLATGMALGQSIGGPRNIAPAVAAPARNDHDPHSAHRRFLVRMRAQAMVCRSRSAFLFFKGPLRRRGRAKDFQIIRQSPHGCVTDRLSWKFFLPPASTVTMSRSNTDATDAITIDGTILGPGSAVSGAIHAVRLHQASTGWR